MTLPPADLALLRPLARARACASTLRTPRAPSSSRSPSRWCCSCSSTRSTATRRSTPCGAAGQVKFAQFYTPSIGIFSLDDRVLHVA